MLRFSLLSISLPVLCIAWLTSSASAATDDAAAIARTGSVFSEIARKATPGVVFIHVEKTIEVAGHRGPAQLNDPFDFFGEDFRRRFFHGGSAPDPRRRKFRQQGQGSGFLITKDGYILTNSHVVGDADKITVKLHDGREFRAKRVGSDEKSEVAVIKIDDGEEFPVLPLGRSDDLEVGEWVAAIGNPFGLAATLTVGVVSAKGRSNVGIAAYEDFIQTDAAINPGNSGGPLLNTAGEVVGINTAIYSRSGGYMGIGFAIPIDMARAIKDQLVATGKVVRGFLGVMIQDVTPDLADTFGMEDSNGVIISMVGPKSAAEKAGLEPGDVVVELNGETVKDVASFRNDVSSMAPGTRMTLTVLRDGKLKQIKAEAGELPSSAAADEVDAEEDVLRLGLTVQDLTPATAERFGYEVDEGVLVSQVEPDSAAAEAGLRPGNLVASVNRAPVASVAEYEAELKKAKDKDHILLLVKSGSRARFVVLQTE